MPTPARKRSGNLPSVPLTGSLVVRVADTNRRFEFDQYRRVPRLRWKDGYFWGHPVSPGLGEIEMISTPAVALKSTPWFPYGFPLERCSPRHHCPRRFAPLFYSARPEQAHVLNANSGRGRYRNQDHRLCFHPFDEILEFKNGRSNSVRLSSP